jgi:excisionase family DNA binding protein
VVGGQVIELPPQVATLFNRIFEDFSSGKSITIISHDAKMTTQQAADHIGVSRPTLIKLLEKYDVPVETIGRHRRIDFGAVKKLKSQLKSTQSSILRDLRREEMAQGLYDSPEQSPIKEV